ncbi:oligosaccharide flippase family protein [Pseudoalteromonas sp. SCSIO 43101]|uniref:lipopolysaccharide biosynthesis protein n=1 Tax=Pseudoalteromonas sp. SCSIO 43101 TaxID=2822847 RepID=UPI00202ADFBF|nr:oligosaccharide flippase family protein [Pseudoalteromonas sp. SCSIO 43101]URQ88899.1 oligosaccharide flippase family protein [Pseudoalteromonas sp. SCSIO 43101]
MSNLKQIGYFALAIFAVKGFGFLLLPITTRFLEKSEFGELNFLVTMSALCSLVVSLGLPELLLKQQYPSFREKMALFRDSLVLTICFSALFLGCSFIFSEQIIATLPAQIKVIDFRLLILNLTFASVLAIPYTYYRLFGYAQKYCFFSIAHTVMQTCLTVTLLVLGLSVTGVMISGVVCTFMIMLVTLSDMRHVLKVSYSRFSWRIEKSQTLFLTSIIASGLFVYVGNGAENWFIVAQFNESVLASYYVAAQFAIITSFTFEPIRLWWFAKRFSLIKQDKTQYQNYAITSLNAGLAMCVLMSLLAPIALNSVLPAEYHGKDSWLILLIIVVAIRHHSDIFNIGCYMHKNGVFVSLINFITALLGLSLLYFLVPNFGVEGAILSLIIMQSFKLVCLYSVSQYFEPLNLNFAALIPSWLALASITFITLQFNELSYAKWVVCLIYLVGLAFQYKSLIKHVITSLMKEHQYAQLL